MIAVTVGSGQWAVNKKVGEAEEKIFHFSFTIFHFPFISDGRTLSNGK
jgi:hypothetical protein